MKGCKMQCLRKRWNGDMSSSLWIPRANERAKEKERERAKERERRKSNTSNRQRTKKHIAQAHSLLTVSVSVTRGRWPLFLERYVCVCVSVIMLSAPRSCCVCVCVCVCVCGRKRPCVKNQRCRKWTPVCPLSVNNDYYVPQTGLAPLGPRYHLLVLVPLVGGLVRGKMEGGVHLSSRVAGALSRGS